MQTMLPDMPTQNKYEELDKQVSKQIMKEFKGKCIEHVCDECEGKGSIPFGGDCKNCKGTGTITIEY